MLRNPIFCNFPGGPDSLFPLSGSTHGCEDEGSDQFRHPASLDTPSCHTKCCDSLYLLSKGRYDETFAGEDVDTLAQAFISVVFLSKTFYPLPSIGSTQSSQHDC